MTDFTLKDDIHHHLDKLAQTPPEFRHINTFMKRRTHMSDKAETALRSDTFKDYLVNPTEIGKLGDVSAISDLRTLFANPTAPLVLEIGFGMGKSLVQMAKDAPHRNFVGIEVHEPGIGNCAYLAHELQLTNLKLVNGDAIALLDNLPEAHLDTVQLYFPDPWQKKRHYKRRFVTTERMQRVVRVLTTGGIFHTATDWEHYAFWMLEILQAMPELRNLAVDGQFYPRPDFRPLTKFEQRGLDSGHGVWDLLYQKV